MKRAALSIVLALGVALAVTACEPPATITATVDFYDQGCTSVGWIDGKVTPAKATPKVILQRTIGGKWVDYPTKSYTGVKATAEVTGDGTYEMAFTLPAKQEKIHLRVRSNSGESVSKGFYVQTWPYESDSCG